MGVTPALPAALGAEIEALPKQALTDSGGGVLRLPPTSLGDVFVVVGVAFYSFIGNISLILEVLKQKH